MTMNRTAALVLALLAVLGVLYASVQVGASVRERVLESRCLESGGTPLWAASSPSDDRPDGFLRFVCAASPSDVA